MMHDGDPPTVGVKVCHNLAAGAEGFARVLGTRVAVSPLFRAQRARSGALPVLADVKAPSEFGFGHESCGERHAIHP